MATVQYTKIETQWGGYPAVMFRWPNMTNGDTGAPARVPAHTDITWQARGNFSAGSTVRAEGTLDDQAAPPNGSFGPHHQVDLTLAEISTSGYMVVPIEHPLQIRPHITTGDGSTSITVDALCVKQWKE